MSSLLLKLTSDEARNQAHAILNGRKYKANELHGPFSGYLRAFGHLIDKVLDKTLGPLGRFLAAIFRPIGHFLGDDVHVFFIGLILFILILVWIVRRIKRRSLMPPAQRAEFNSFLTSKDAHGFYKSAREAGNWSLALRYLYITGVLKLYEHKVISLIPGTTNSELKTQVSRDEFSLLTREFERSFYGDREVIEEDLSQSENWWRDLEDITR